MSSANGGGVGLDVLVVGAGFAGLHQLYLLRKLGYKVKVVETASGLGGIWFWSTYPGARVDSEVPVYQFSWRELWEEWNYSERYPARNEILQYFEYVDKKLDLSKDIDFNTRIVSAEFNSASNKWHVKAEGGKEYVATILDLCVGGGAKPYEGAFKGMPDFKGVIHHSYNWPREVDLKGKRVAVIGTGATGVQIIQEIGPKVGHLTVFQRTPNMALPMNNPKLTAEFQSRQKPKYPDEFVQTRKELFGFNYSPNPKCAFEDSYEARQEFYNKLWSYGDFHFWVANYADFTINEQANTDAYEFWCRKVRARLTNPAMQEKLAPLKPVHPIGTKRPSLECSYYEVFNQSNVDLIDVRATPIESFTSNGIRTSDGIEHSFDVIVLATGYDIISGSLTNIDIKSTSGESLKDKLAKGIRTFLGLATCGFPNMFFIYNIGAPTAFTNGPSCVEVQGEWLVKLIDHALTSGKHRIEASETAEADWTRKLQEIFASTLFPKADSWYQGANIPGKKREPMCYLGGLKLYGEEIAKVAEKGYEGFLIA